MTDERVTEGQALYILEESAEAHCHFDEDERKIWARGVLDGAEAVGKPLTLLTENEMWALAVKTALL